MNNFTAADCRDEAEFGRAEKTVREMVETRPGNWKSS